MPRPSRLLRLVSMIPLAVACRDAAAPGTPSAGPAFATASDSTSRYLISYSSYLGGSNDEGGFAIALDAAGNMYVVGYTYSTNFPTAGAFQTTRHGPANDAFVTKINPVTGLVYSTYLGGTDPDPLFGETATGIALDAQGDAYVTGYTYSTSFPTTAGALQTTFGGVKDGFVAELNPSGSALVYSTYLGGRGNDKGNKIAVDAAGNAYVTGNTASTDFPTTPSAFQTTFAGGTSDAFVTALNPSGSALLFSTYLGGTDTDQGNDIAVDAAGNAYLVGNTGSINFPITGTVVPADPGGGNDAFVAALTGMGSGLLFSTHLGGTALDLGLGIAIDTAGTVYVTGQTSSNGVNNFPITPGAFQPLIGGFNDAYVTRITRVATPANVSMRP